MKIVKAGTIGKLRYELREINQSDNIYEVIIFQNHEGLCVAHNTGRVACEALITGMQIGKSRDIYSVANKKLGFTEYG